MADAVRDFFKATVAEEMANYKGRRAYVVGGEVAKSPEADTSTAKELTKDFRIMKEADWKDKPGADLIKNWLDESQKTLLSLQEEKHNWANRTFLIVPSEKSGDILI